MGRYQKSTGGQTGFKILNPFNGFLTLNTHMQMYRLSHIVTHKGGYKMQL